MKKLALFLLFILSSCMGEKISVHMDYLSHENLASYHVGTPDPLLNNPPVGQRLIVSWWVPSSYLDLEDLHLEISIRLCDRQRIEKSVCLKRFMGTYVYSLINDDYFTTGGILTYKVLLVGGDEILETWTHQLWAEWIELDPTSEHIDTGCLGEISDQVIDDT